MSERPKDEGVMENLLILTVGFPLSGKSTWARAQGHPVVCPDAIRLALHGRRYEPLAEPHVWAIAHTMVRALFLAGHSQVILDATNNTRERRGGWLSDAWVTSFQTIGTDVSTCLARARERGDVEIIPVIECMAVAHEAVSPNEGACRMCI